MIDLPRVTIQTFTSAPADDQVHGLLGWLTLDIDELLVVDSVALRRTRGGRLALSFPTRRDRGGVQHPLVRPPSDEARRAIEAAVFRALRARGVPA